MRIEELVMVSFGPFANRRVKFGPGMTVLVGKNEAGKSTMHAALYAAICGLRRGRGQARREDQDFAARHRPWSTGKSWEVGAYALRDDGRRLELRQGLDGSSPSYARDAAGRDLTSSIANEGSPDASKWFGLDRRSFAATAFVRQAEVLEVLTDATALQQHLQRAAAGTAKDETAARALARIAEFEKENVGQDRVNSTKPLQRAKQRLAQATEARDQARNASKAVRDRSTAAIAEDEVAVRLASEIGHLEAGVARGRATEATRRLDRALELADRFPTGAPRSRSDDAELAIRVGGAIEAWRHRLQPVGLVGATAEDLRIELSSLPARPTGDDVPDSTVTAAKAAYDKARLALDFHSEQKPIHPTGDHATADEGEVRRLATALETESLAVDREGRAPEQIAARPRSRGLSLPRIVQLAGLAAVIVGVVFALMGTAAGYFVAAIGAVFVALGAWRSRGRGLRAAQGELVRQPDQGRAEVSSGSSRERLRELGLPDSPAELRSIADNLARAAGVREQLELWNARHEELAAGVLAAATVVADSLRGRGAAWDGDVPSAIEVYLAECHSRRSRLELANRRPALEERLAYREAAERSAEDALNSAGSAAQVVRGAGDACGISGEPEDVCKALTEWLEVRKADLGRIERELRDWTELQTLLDGRTIAELLSEVGDYDRRAQELEAAAGGPVGALSADVVDRIPGLRERQAQAQKRAAALHAEAKMIGGARSEVAAESEVAEADRDLRRVENLARMLGLTREFLERAQERVHLRVAPLLQTTLNSWLPRITSNRYVESLVDPQSLTVRVRGPDAPWREAQLLSNGTAEQIYLLLRLAVTEHLTRGQESCPLILDDVVVQSDAERMKSLLELLHELSATRQVILFSLSDDAAEWAKAHLVPPRDRFESLEGVVAV